MADRLYLSLWYPNFRLEALPAALTGVLRQFALVGSKRVAAASSYPINFSEAPTYQRIYVNDDRSDVPAVDASDAIIESAVAEATEQLHDDMAYEFEMTWQLWIPDAEALAYNRLDAEPEADPYGDADSDPRQPLRGPDAAWKLRTQTVRILGFGPRFDMAGYEQNGHLLRRLRPRHALGSRKRSKTKTSTRPPRSTSSRM